jgi:hypothetical protein
LKNRSNQQLFGGMQLSISPAVWQPPINPCGWTQL